jgi:hypothetical protein
MKHTPVTIALTFLLISFCAAQDVSGAPQASLDPGSVSASSLANAAHIPGPPSYCKPCLFYGGDFDGYHQNANGLFDGYDSYGDGQVYVPFTVPKGKEWKVTGLLVNLLTVDFDDNPSEAYWEIRKGVSSGNGGTLVAGGAGLATPATVPASYLFNCQDFEGYCFAFLVTGMKVSLPAGRYWLMVEPLCGEASRCYHAEYFVLDDEDMPPPNHYGPIEPWDDSFYSSNAFGYYFAPTWGGSGTCRGQGCDRFSTAVLGTQRRMNTRLISEEP